MEEYPDFFIEGSIFDFFLEEDEDVEGADVEHTKVCTE